MQTGSETIQASRRSGFVGGIAPWDQQYNPRADSRAFDFKNTSVREENGCGTLMRGAFYSPLSFWHSGRLSGLAVNTQDRAESLHCPDDE